MERSVWWNKSRDCWETEQMDLLSGQQAVWSEIWPASGMTRNGALSELPTSAPLTSESVFSLLATPQANLGSCGGITDTGEASGRGHSVSLADQIEHLVP